MEKKIHCEQCGCETEKRSHTQKYCENCSHDRDMIRKRLWARNNPKSDAAREIQNKRSSDINRLVKSHGVKFTDEQTIASVFDHPGYVWIVRFFVPFDYAVSKNHSCTTTKNGHVFLRKESRKIQDLITLKTKQALHGIKVAHNKIWVSLHVEKPNHKGDAINAIDLVCDAIKKVTYDDRLFCIGQVNWSINKKDPKILIQIGQDSVEDVGICSYCGRMLPLENFPKNRSLPLGVSRTCRECDAEARKALKEKKNMRAGISYPDDLGSPTSSRSA